MSTSFEKALTAIDAAHALDPTPHTLPDGTTLPYELHYAQKCTAYLEKHTPTASEHLRLAIRAQHFRRWEVPRASYPLTRPGYHAWRTFLKKRQASLTHDLCLASGCTSETAERVGALIRKEDLNSDEETQILEDVACLVFLDDQLDAFDRSHDEDKIVGILRKTWGKMSSRGHALALEISMGDRAREVVGMALGSA
ncbi:hypothetical protein BDU57DRAFT_536846 [Ampelomyces quisqualis]|uniref:Glutamyl-tRNA synthetase n=1 Tax=Ampelomyces quisqualis TaxID=50730 RepID=A0A6A5QYH3_AMPQU|nr:hypothetical protein BDU57DRAFT_536846 [Ampelomyces quisqualis]